MISFNDAFSLQASGDLTGAEVAYRQILINDPLHVEAQHYLGIVLHQQGMSQEGVSLILAALEIDANSASRYNDLGNILFTTGNSSDATIAFRFALEIDPNDPIVWNNLGYALYQDNNKTDAEIAYRNSVQCDASFVPALNNLASLLAEIGREEESSYFYCLVFIQPPYEGKSFHHLGVAHYRLGNISEAAKCYEAWLRQEPGNPHASHLLAACSGINVPEKASNDYVTKHFNEIAHCFDERLIGSLEYRGPEIIKGLLEKYSAHHKFLNVLDAGCGTGLCAFVLRPYAHHLIGVDLADQMLIKARQLNLYNELHEAELDGYLQNKPNIFNLIVMADTLIYFGNLAPFFASVRRALKPDGYFLFTVESASGEMSQKSGYSLDASGRYRHSRDFICQSLDEADLKLIGIEEVVLRKEFHQPAHGFAVAAKVS